MTVLLVGAINGEVYLVQRTWTELDGWATAPGRIEGRHPFFTDQIAIGAEPKTILTVMPQSFADPDPCRSRFEMVRIPDDADCAWVLEHEAELFGDDSR